MELLRRAALDDPGEVARIEGFVAEQHGSVFHRPAWLRAITRGTGNPALGLVTEAAGAITGWLPLNDVFSPIFGRALVSSGFAVGGGVLAVSEEAAEMLLRGAEELACRYGASSVELRGGNAALPGWSAITGKHANFARTLERDAEAQLLSIPRKARAEVRKGLEMDLLVTHGRDRLHRDGHYRAYSEGLRNHGTPAFPRSLYNAVLDEFGADAEISLVRHRGVPVAAVLSLYHQGACMPFWGGSTPAARALRATERMYYALMCHAIDRGCSTFDFGRSKVASGPFAFKKNWGFVPEPLTYWCWNPPQRRARNIDPNAAVYAARIALWQRLPLPLANVLGPFIARGLG